MLFLLKRTWQGGLAGLGCLLLIAIILRQVRGDGTPLLFSLRAVGLAFAALAGIVVSDGLLHGLCWWLGGVDYRQRFRELVDVFRGQGVGALVAGSLMAGLGEEPLFRGLGTDPVYLAGAAVVFGLLHHIRRRLWPFTLWAIYEGLLFAGILYLTSNLLVTMIAHTLHDLTGFLLFRHESRRS
jgi:membrane protease YdiL (CAAX protease family)